MFSPSFGDAGSHRLSGTLASAPIDAADSRFGQRAVDPRADANIEGEHQFSFGQRWMRRWLCLRRIRLAKSITNTDRPAVSIRRVVARSRKAGSFPIGLGPASIT